ncbi:HPr kinase/phosphorylase [Tateyamaria sp. SN3-11]|uniref:HPr kinase/phosphorylase n=1 Tax=Tateyamaria sp. SN3-11 TaxID=3092147 RepID=UPI0039E8A978
MRVHASAVALDGQGVLITGAAGSGKSSLALMLLAHGAVLISDDQTELSRDGDTLWARAPDSIQGLIEARSVGILTAKSAPAPIVLAIDMDRVETKRLPERHEISVLGVKLACLHKTDSPAWPAAIVQYLKGGRRDP